MEVPRCLTEARSASLEGAGEILGVRWLVCIGQRGELSLPGGYRPLRALSQSGARLKGAFIMLILCLAQLSGL